jgi:hypothetical protein
MWSLFRIELGPQFPPTGNTKHTLRDSTGSRPFPPFTALEIVHTPGEAGFYLMHECSDGIGTDTWHETLDDAMQQADFEFGVKPTDWGKTERAYG